MPPADQKIDPESQVGEADRGLLSDLAVNAISGGKQNHKPQNQSGLGGLASSFLGGGGGHSGGGGGGGGGGHSSSSFGGTAGHLIGSFLDKPHANSQQNSGGGGGYSGSSSGSGGHSSGGGGFLGGILGGHHGSSVCLPTLQSFLMPLQQAGCC